MLIFNILARLSHAYLVMTGQSCNDDERESEYVERYTGHERHFY